MQRLIILIHQLLIVVSLLLFLSGIGTGFWIWSEMPRTSDAGRGLVVPIIYWGETIYAFKFVSIAYKFLPKASIILFFAWAVLDYHADPFNRWKKSRL